VNYQSENISFEKSCPYCRTINVELINDPLFLTNFDLIFKMEELKNEINLHFPRNPSLN